MNKTDRTGVLKVIYILDEHTKHALQLLNDDRKWNDTKKMTKRFMDNNDIDLYILLF